MIEMSTGLIQRKYLVFEANPEKNREDILALWKRNFSGIAEQRFSWLYENNPYGPARCWLAKDLKHDKVVGATSLFPKKFFIHRDPCIAGIAGDFVVDKDHRGFGPALSLQKAAVSSCTETPFHFLYGIPTKQSESVLQRAGYKFVGYFVRMTKLLKLEGYLQRKNITPGAAKVITKPFDLALKLFSKDSYYKSQNGLLLEKISVFDQRFDDFWGKISGVHSVIGERTSRFLNWRFVQCPHRTYNIVTLTRKGAGEILGYIVFYINQNIVYIADFLSMDRFSIFDALISESLQLWRKERREAVSITYYGDGTLTKKLSEYGFSIRGHDMKLIACIDPDSPLTSCLSNKNNWYLLEGDNDI